MAGRAVLALVLTLGFYLLAFGLVLALLAIPYFEWTDLHYLNIRITLFCLGGATIILYSVLPRIDFFSAPGPRATPQSHPRLFAELGAIAAAVEQPLPDEVYLVEDINAYVLERGGIMGIGGRRVMGIGLPLMRILRISEFRTLLIHEFGHYRGGHTRLAPWIYRTREAIIRTVAHLSGHSGVLMLPFVQYARLFLMVTQDISRQQEYEADRLAAQIAGSQPCIAALRAHYGASVAYELYRRQNTGIYVDGMIAPPLPDEDFMRFMRLPRTGTLIRQAVEEELAHRTAHPYDSHPSLAARIAALERLPAGQASTHEPLAFSLLDPMPASEAPQTAKTDPQPLAGALPWEDAGAAGERYRWEDDVRRNFHLLRGWTVANLPDLAPSLAVVGGRLGTRWVADEAAARGGRDLLAGALGLALIRAGWVVESSPTGSAVLRKEDATVDPAREIEQLASGATDANAWRGRAAAMGVASIRLDALRPAA